MKNIEFKTRVNDFSGILKNLKKIKAEYKGILRQKDTYFYSASGYLKHREINGKENQMILYFRSYEPDENISNYKIVTLNKEICKRVIDLLRPAFGVKAVIHKNRKLWIYRNTRIHLDEVKGLGRFIELETIVKKGTEKQREDEYNGVKELLNIAQFSNLRISYVDMAVNQMHTLIHQKEGK